MPLALCPMSPVACPNLALGCNVTLLRNSVATHISATCAVRTWTCKACGAKMSIADKNKHTCLLKNKMVECYLGCGETFRQSDMQEHEFYDCDFAVMECKAEREHLDDTHTNYGCGMVVSKKDLQQHQSCCENRLVSCPNDCQHGVLSIRAKDLAAHLLDCPRRTFCCPLCNKTVIEAGHQKSCEHQSVTCTTCGESMPFFFLTTHKKSTCRLIHCKNCGASVQKSQKVEHDAHICKQRTAPCRLGCGANIKLTDTAHGTSQCPKRIVACNACGDPVSAEDVDSGIHALQCRMRQQACPLGCGGLETAETMPLHLYLPSAKCRDRHAAINSVQPSSRCDCGASEGTFCATCLCCECGKSGDQHSPVPQTTAEHLQTCLTWKRMWKAQLENLVLGVGSGLELERRVNHVARYARNRHEEIAFMLKPHRDQAALPLCLKESQAPLAFAILALAYERGGHVMAGNKIRSSMQFLRFLSLAALALEELPQQGSALSVYLEMFTK